MKEKKVLLLTTGGTIAGNIATDHKSATISTVQDFGGLVSKSIQAIKSCSKVDVKMKAVEICDIDSSDILPEHWKMLSDAIKKQYDAYDAFLVTHGTNTMGYTAAALSFALPNLNKPVILTGSQVPLGMPGSDAIVNLENALRVAVEEKDENPPIKGVLAVFGSHIITGTRVKKSTEFDYDAFKSFSSSSIGRIGRIIEINKANLEKHLGYLKTNQYTPAKTAKNLFCENEFDMHIASLTEFPGMNVDVFETLVDQCGIKAFILRAFGAGDPSKDIIEKLMELKARKIPVVISTQAPNGNANFQVNEPGQVIRDSSLAIPAYDMSIESMTVKMAWLLAKKEAGKLNYDDLCKQMITDIRGEVEVIWEI